METLNAILIFLGCLAGLWVLRKAVERNRAIDAQLRSSSLSKPKKHAASVTKARPKSDFDSKLLTHDQMFKERWRAMMEQSDTGTDLGFEPWRYDDVTDRQLNKLEGLGAPKNLLKSLSKGTASDLIAMMYPPKPDQVEKLKVMEAWEAGLSEVGAHEKLRVLSRDPVAQEKWLNRKPDLELKLFCALYELKLPSKATHQDACKLVSDFIAEDEGKKKALKSIASIVEDFKDPKELRDVLEMKKPSQKVILEGLKQWGTEVLESGHCSSGDVAEEILRLHPELERY